MIDEESMVNSLIRDAELTEGEARAYLSILKNGKVKINRDDKDLLSLFNKGMIIVSSDNQSYIPTHPRLAVANQYRVWRERMVREINERRIRIDKLILRLIPIYEKTMERKNEKM